MTSKIKIKIEGSLNRDRQEIWVYAGRRGRKILFEGISTTQEDALRLVREHMERIRRGGA